MSYLFPSYMALMFSYGFLRTMRAEYIEKYNVFGKKVGISLMTGIVYASPFGVPKLMDLFDRVDIYINKKDSTKYEYAYEECQGVCKNKNVIL